MAEQYVGEIRMFAGNFAPDGWAFCDGSLVSISQYEALHVLIGTTYGGDGVNNIALPDLRGRIPVHMGTLGSDNYTLAQAGGVETVTLSTAEMPAHTHLLVCANNTANSPNPNNNLIGLSSRIQAFYADNPSTPMNSNGISPAGNSGPHDNFMPYLCINFIISLIGVFPSPN